MTSSEDSAFIQGRTGDAESFKDQKISESQSPGSKLLRPQDLAGPGLPFLSNLLVPLPLQGPRNQEERDETSNFPEQQKFGKLLGALLKIPGEGIPGESICASGLHVQGEGWIYQSTFALFQSFLCRLHTYFFHLYLKRHAFKSPLTTLKGKSSSSQKIMDVST